ncbi:MAG: tRNA-guanine(15) transglycosylase, partial [Methanoregula sp.]|nr:tRNA-guanine(15) transglycosylase [Methanoregula sp.]
GSFRVDELTELPCACAVCRTHTADEIRTAKDRTRLLALHNLAVTLAEIARIRQAIIDGTLWELVDERCRNHPLLLSGYRELLHHTGTLEAHDRVSKRRFFYRGDESCARTEILRYQRSLDRLRLGARVLVACDGRVREGYDDVLLYKPPFGPYPPELSETFPIGQSEIPDWDPAMVRQGCRGILALVAGHPESQVTVAGLQDYRTVLSDVCGDTVEVIE